MGLKWEAFWGENVAYHRIWTYPVSFDIFGSQKYVVDGECLVGKISSVINHPGKDKEFFKYI